MLIPSSSMCVKPEIQEQIIIIIVALLCARSTCSQNNGGNGIPELYCRFNKYAILEQVFELAT